MNQAPIPAFELAHSDIPQVTLLDEDPVTTDWTLPPVRKWCPARPTLRERLLARVAAWMRSAQR